MTTEARRRWEDKTNAGVGEAKTITDNGRDGMEQGLQQGWKVASGKGRAQGAGLHGIRGLELADLEHNHQRFSEGYVQFVRVPMYTSTKNSYYSTLVVVL